MAVGALVQKFFPSPRDVYSPKRELRAFTVLTSIFSDIDVIFDWLFYAETLDKRSVPQTVKTVQLFFCCIGTVTWMVLASDGWLARPFVKCLKLNRFSTGHVLIAGVLLEDLPQVILSILIEHVFGTKNISTVAAMNLVTALYDTSIRTAEAWDVRHDLLHVGLPMMTYLGHKDEVLSVAMLDDEKRFITGSADETAKLWDLERGECVRTFEGHSGYVRSVAKLDGSKFVSGSWDRTAKLWDIESGECIRTFKGHSNMIWSVAGIDANSFITGSRDHTARLWNIEAEECVRAYEGHSGAVYSVANVDGSRFLSGSMDDTIKLWNIKTAECIFTFEGHFDYVYAVVNIDGTKFLSGSRDRTAKLWNIETRQCLQTFKGHTDWIYSISVIAKELFLTGSGDKTCKLWNMNTGKCLNTFSGHLNWVNAVANVNGNTFLTASDDKTVKRWAITMADKDNSKLVEEEV